MIALTHPRIEDLKICLMMFDCIFLFPLAVPRENAVVESNMNSVRINLYEELRDTTVTTL